ncbi:MAG TPA: glycosyltransferase [Usitatibacter sp.]|jgi:glycosyltransferase involved in cell wall biosynthesis|nr:glycosyltransferase [Usitatibacter sp.]
MNRPTVLILGPSRAAVSGVSTHLNLLLDSSLADDYELVHFQVGGEGRQEGAIARLARFLLSPLGLAATILFRHVTLVHINTSLNPRAYWRDIAYLLVSKAMGARVLYQVHGGKLPLEFFKGHRALTGFLRWTLNLPDVVVVLARCELRAYDEFLPEQQVVLIPNGIDLRPYAAVPTVNAPADKPLRLLFFGRLHRMKGLYEILQALRLATELGVDARLIVAGSGPEEDRLKRYAQALGIAPRTIFAGTVFGRDKLKLMAGSDVMLLPSYTEGLPYSLLEAMAAGLPVIATPVGAIPDVMTEGIHGCIVPPRDGRAIAEALALLHGDREKLSWMSRASRRRIRAAYSIERCASEFALQYARLCGHMVVAGAANAHVASPPARTPRPAAPARLTGHKE